MNPKQLARLFAALVVLLSIAFTIAWMASDWLLAKATPPQMHVVTDEPQGIGPDW